MNDLIWTISAVIFIGSWMVGAILGFLIKKRIKAIYPELHDKLYASAVVEHNIRKSLEYQKFSIFSSNWKKIDDRALLNWLRIQRVAFFIMVGLLVVFFAVVAGALFLDTGLMAT